MLKACFFFAFAAATLFLSVCIIYFHMTFFFCRHRRWLFVVFLVRVLCECVSGATMILGFGPISPVVLQDYGHK